MPTKSKSDDDERVIDVAKSGKKRPDATSRPLIIGHKNMIEDPMVKAEASATLAVKKDESSDEGEPIVVSHEDTKIEPSQAKTIEPLKKADAEQPEAAAEATPPPEEKAQETTEEKSEASPSTPEEAPAEEAPSDAAPSEAKPTDKQIKQNEEELAKQAAVQKLIESKQYVVPIGEAKKRRNGQRWLLLLVFVILFAVVAVDLLVDAGIIKTSFNPPVDLIKN